MNRSRARTRVASTAISPETFMDRCLAALGVTTCSDARCSALGSVISLRPTAAEERPADLVASSCSLVSKPNQNVARLWDLTGTVTTVA